MNDENTHTNNSFNYITDEFSPKNLIKSKSINEIIAYTLRVLKTDELDYERKKEFIHELTSVADEMSSHKFLQRLDDALEYSNLYHQIMSERNLKS